MKILLVILGAFILPLVGKAAYPSADDTRFLLNQGYGAKVRLGDQEVDKKIQVLRATLDYSVVGGEVGAISLRDMDGKPAKIPNKAIIVDCVIDVLTAPTSTGSATIALGTGSSTIDLKAATAIASYTGRVACIPVGSAATAIKNSTGETTVTATVAVSPLSAGKLDVYIEYLIGK